MRFVCIFSFFLSNRGRILSVKHIFSIRSLVNIRVNANLIFIFWIFLIVALYLIRFIRAIRRQCRIKVIVFEIKVWGAHFSVRDLLFSRLIECIGIFIIGRDRVIVIIRVVLYLKLVRGLRDNKLVKL
jgi:hypothetical protein